MISRRTAICLAVIGLSTTASIGSVSAADYPTRPVKWVVGYPPGGATDIIARLIGQRLSERLGQQFVIENKGGASGIRVNTVNPDAVLQGSRIWGSSWREERAASYGIEPDELEEHYRMRTTLGVNIFPDDIAQAVLHFASEERSGKSTGNVLNVDGGVPAAYSR